MASALEAAGTAGGPTQHTPNQADGLTKLRTPFPDNLIQALPKITCRACSDSGSRNCQQHQKQRCNRCQNWITTAHVDLDYVGHAELTSRLLDVDPLWTWEPLAFDEQGLPRFDGNRGLWIRLTVCGHTRIGYGDAQGKVGANAIKEAIGDALRNAAMRFGAALDLWAKSDLHADQEAAANAAGPGPQDERTPLPQPARGFEAAAPRPPEANPKADALTALEEKVRAGWNNADATAQNLAEARAKGLLDQGVPGPDGLLYKVGDLLETRLAELRGQQRGAA